MVFAALGAAEVLAHHRRTVRRATCFAPTVTAIARSRPIRVAVAEPRLRTPTRPSPRP